MQVLWSVHVLLTKVFSGLPIYFPSPKNTTTNDRCVNGWSVPVLLLMVVMCARVYMEILILQWL